MDSERTTRRVTALGACVAVAALVALVAVGTGGGASPTTSAPPTGEVARRDLTATVTIAAQLERADTRAVYWQQPPQTAAASGQAGQPSGAGGAPLSGAGGQFSGAATAPQATPTSDAGAAPSTATTPPATSPPSTSPATTAPPTTTTTTRPTTTTTTTAPSTTSTTAHPPCTPPPSAPCSTTTTAPSTTVTTAPCTPTPPSTAATSPSTGDTRGASAGATVSLLVAPSAASTSATPVQAEPTASATPAQGAPSASAGQQATDQTPAAGDQQAGTHTVTAVAAAGAQLDRGDVLFAVDARPTVALVGTEPAFRALAAGVDDGADVAQLEENLAALSHLDGDAVDAHFGPATAAAVEAWQDAMGFPVTGTVELGDIAFLPAPVTVAAAVPAVGDQVTAGGHILDVTGETVLAVGDLPVRARGDVAAGSPTRVTLPDGTSVDGTVRTIAADATRPTGADVTTSTVEVTIQLDVTDSPAALPGADVTLAVTTSTHPAVLTVPVAAIVDGGDGRPAVLLSSASDDEPALVPVDTGTTAGGYVEVAPGPLAEGDPVVLPGRDPADAG